ncbi:hypothetical protein mRhiFer1_009132 [Rhinolophus ferrumequinum]|uniref:Uncharacterized protein n=1 Tax=Rhinolophus ferrumequinum TaxID=59479 RepID=A0A7J7SJ44_RHIFE|nr:hypothetical protein mRhiFer1_009132 [Rhinolophus ferrumequinum]
MASPTHPGAGIMRTTLLPGGGPCSREPGTGSWRSLHGVAERLPWPERLGCGMGTLSEETGLWPPYLSPLRFKLNGMLLSQPHLLFGCHQMLEEGQDSRHKQNPQRRKCKL